MLKAAGFLTDDYLEKELPTVKTERVRHSFWKGFSLIEIIIVVCIIGLLAVIAAPNFLRMRLNANENLIRADLRAFSTANESYRALQNPPTYAPGIATLRNLNYIDNTWLNPGNKHGYNFNYQTGAAAVTYALEAMPLTQDVTGTNSYCVDQSGVIVFNVGGGLGTANGCVGGAAIPS